MVTAEARDTSARLKPPGMSFFLILSNIFQPVTTVPTPPPPPTNPPFLEPSLYHPGPKKRAQMMVYCRLGPKYFFFCYISNIY